MKKRDKFTLHAEIGKALAHPARVLILDILREGEMSVSELIERIKLGPASVSKYLAMLKAAGLIEDRKEGTKIYYRITSQSYVKSLFKGLDGVVRETVARYQAYIEEEEEGS